MIMNKKRLLKAMIISVLCLSIIILFIISVPHIANLLTYPEKSFNNEITSISCESEKIPYVVACGRIYKGEKVISIFDLCEKQNKSYQNTLCIFKNRAYFICLESDQTNHYWSISSVDLNSLDIQTHFMFKNPAKAYSKYTSSEEYSERNSYYIDGKIVLNDFISVWEYDLNLSFSKEYSYDRYDFPIREIYGVTANDSAIKIHTPQWEKTFTFYDMSQESVGISTIYSFKDRKMLNNRPYITDFFNEKSVQYINEKIYAVGECKDRLGGAYAIILEYDRQQNKWKYVTGVYTWDSATEAYIVPEKTGDG